MLVIVGILVVFAAVIGGFILEEGNPLVLMQPAELLIVGGSAVGIVLVANPLASIRKVLAGVIGVLRRSKYTRGFYLENLRMLYELFAYSRRAGILKLESEVEEPHASQVLSSYPAFLKDQTAVDFVCDSLRMVVAGATNPPEIDQLMELDIEVQRAGRHEPVNALTTVADSLPGLGIVAAVLGVVVTMQAIGSAPEEVGQKVAAALVGTFLGILLCYGVTGPLAAHLEGRNEAHVQYLQVLRAAILAFVKGAQPILAAEYARRSIPLELRPSFADMEANFRREARIPKVTDSQREMNAQHA